MSTISYSPRQSSFPILPVLLLLLTGALALAALGAFAHPRAGTHTRPARSYDWGSLELSSHARTTHATDRWKPVSIRRHFEHGKCTPSTYSCPDGVRDIAWCSDPGRPGQAIGLVINRISRTIITGFGAPLDYWRNACP